MNVPLVKIHPASPAETPAYEMTSVASIFPVDDFPASAALAVTNLNKRILFMRFKGVP